MALVVKDRVRQTTTTAGTGTITLSGSVSGFQSFSVIGNGNTTYYCIVDPVAGDWEVGIGAYTSSGTTLSRTTVLDSSNSGSLVNFGSSVKDVFVVYPAGRSIYTDTAGAVITPATASVLGVVSGGTGLSSGTSGGVLYYSASGTLASSAALTANALIVGGGAGVAPSTITTGTGVVTALGVNTGSAGAFVVNGGALGTPSSGTVTNLTGTASININGTVGATTPTTGSFTTVTASADSSFTSTGALLISKGTTAQQPGSPATGMIRYNTTTNQFEGYSGASPAWSAIGGGAAVSNDTSTASNLYPLFANATSGTPTTIYTSNAKLLYKPSTGELQASEIVASNGIFLNNATVSSSYTIATNTNGFSVGPITIASGQTVTIASGQRWIVI